MQRTLTGAGVGIAIAALAIMALFASYTMRSTTAMQSGQAPYARQFKRGQDTLSPTDSEPPTVPTGLMATNITQTEISLAWDAAIDDVGVAGYRLYERVRANPYHWLWLLRAGEIDAPETTITGLEPGSQHRYAVTALDAAGNESAKSAILHLYTYQAPQAYHPLSEGEQIYAIVGEPFSYIVAALGAPAPTFTLAAGPVGMDVDALTGRVAWAPVEGDEGRATFTVRAANIVGVDDHTVEFPVHPAGADLTPPGPVANLTATNVTARGATLQWAEATDNVGVAGYRIVAQVAGHGQSLFLAADTSAPVTTFTITTLQPATSYRLWVTAYDVAGNIAPISGVTPAAIRTLDGSIPVTPTVTPLPSPTPTLIPTDPPPPTATPTGTATATQTVQIHIHPPAPSTTDVVSITVAGMHPNNCVPRYGSHNVVGNLIAITSTPSPEPFCLPAEFPWEYAVEVGPLAAGDYTVTHTLANDVTTAYFTVIESQLELDEVIPPYIYVSNEHQPLVAKAGETFTYTVEADGAPPPTFVLITAPAGMTIDPVEGLLTWEIPLEAAPDLTITVRAVNRGGFDEQTFTVHIRSPEIEGETSVQRVRLPLIQR